MVTRALPKSAVVNDLEGTDARDALARADRLFDVGRYAEALAAAEEVCYDPATQPERRSAAEAVMARIAERCALTPHEISPVTEAYHRWYYDGLVWRTTTYLGIPVRKSPSDLWNYQEIIAELRPRVVVEFGTFSGASALFFAHTLRAAGIDGRVLTVDIATAEIAPQVRAEPTIEVQCCSSTDPAVAARVGALRAERPGPVFAILDSDHRKDHVLAELLLLRPLLIAGDYLVVEDANLNGHPVVPEYGPGPFEAFAEYEARYPSDYTHDLLRERKFGFTFATNGFLRRR